jgi:fibrillarin-like pre-rRNA processing protein
MTAPSRLVRREGRLYTLDAEGGNPVYGENIIDVDGDPYREWIPWRSKLSALMKKIEMEFPSKGDILYLGAAQGTTVSHISDLLENGTIFAVEFSATAFRKLAQLAGRRENIIPILEDAFHPERFRAMVPPVDVLYQDVSQKEQLKLFVMNSRIFLKTGGLGILMLKARSIDVTAQPANVYKKVVSGLKRESFIVEDVVELDPFQVDHAAVIIRKG